MTTAHQQRILESQERRKFALILAGALLILLVAVGYIVVALGAAHVGATYMSAHPLIFQ